MKISFLIRMLILTSTMFQIAFAGTKGLDVKLRNIGDGDFYQSPIFQQFLDNRLNFERDKCWQKFGDGMSGIHSIEYGILIPENGDTLEEFWNGKQAIMRRIREGLHHPNEHTGIQGFHGMYIIKPENGQLTIMGIGANADPKKGLTGISPVIKGIKLDQTKPKEGAKIFEQSLCRVSKPFNIGFGV